MYEDIKNLVKYKAGITHVTPHDCKKISTDIFETTKKHVSETTLKRLFGFATVKYKLSKYTLAILQEYVENGCTIVISTKIDPSKTTHKDSTHIKFELQDGNLQSGNCIHEADLDTENEDSKELSVNIKLTSPQAKELVKQIKSSKK